MRVGVLALQGDFQEHLDTLGRIGAKAIAVRLPEDLAHIDRLIIPGGESTTIGKLLVTSGLLAPLKARIKKGMPTWGTCAGAILLAKRIAGGMRDQSPLGCMDITARRNAFGRQLDSFETTLDIKGIGAVPAVFIRAPILESPEKGVEILATFQDKIVAARQGRLLATCFHPELTGSQILHEYFLSL